MAIRLVQYLENSNNERAYVGDTIKMELVITTALGDEGEILSIENDRIGFKFEGLYQPLVGIKDFTIIRSNH